MGPTGKKTDRTRLTTCPGKSSAVSPRGILPERVPVSTPRLRGKTLSSPGGTPAVSDRVDEGVAPTRPPDRAFHPEGRSSRPEIHNGDRQAAPPVRAGMSSLRPGPIVEDNDTLTMYVPLAPDGFARLMASTKALTFATSFSASNETLPTPA